MRLQKILHGLSRRPHEHVHSSLRCNQGARLDGVRTRAVVPHGRTHGTDPTWRDGQRRPTARRCGDSELSPQSQAGSRSLIFDLSIAHDRFGSSSHVQQNGCLSHPQDLDAQLRIAAQRNIRKKHSKNSYHMVCHHTLSKNGMISYHQIVISYQINFISYPLVCHHTNNCHFIPYRYQFIPVYVISYRKGINSYQYMSLYTSVVSYQNMSFHTPWYVIIPTIVISYHTGIISYQYMSVHTVKVSFHTSTCHCILVLFHTKTCHFIPLGMSSYQQLSFHTIQVSFHTSTCQFIP